MKYILKLAIGLFITNIATAQNSVLPPKDGYNSIKDLIPFVTGDEYNSEEDTSHETFHYKILKTVQISQGEVSQNPVNDYLIAKVFRKKIQIHLLSNPTNWNTFKIVNTSPVYIKINGGKIAMPGIQAIATTKGKTAMLTLTKASLEINNMPNNEPETVHLWSRRVKPSTFVTVKKLQEKKQLLEISKKRAIVLK